jgi:hypothetical protein
MPNRFDVFMSRIETKSARNGAPPSQPIGDQHGTHNDKANAKPDRPAQVLTAKGNARHRNKHHA